MDQQSHTSASSSAEHLYMRDIEVFSLLSAQEERELSQRLRAGDQQARERMIVSNLRLVVKLARRYHAPKLGLMDLIEEGNIGLMHAVEKFDPDKGFRFSTYASWWIRHEIERSIMNQSRTVRLPVHVVRELNKYKRLSKTLLQRLQHEPSLKELADETDGELGVVHRTMTYNRPTASIDESLSGSGSHQYTMLDSIENRRAENPMAETLQHEITRHIETWLNFLGDKPREIITRRFGLCEAGLQRGEPQTLEQVAEAVGLTRERVRQIQIQALKKLRSILQKNGYSWDDVSSLRE